VVIYDEEGRGIGLMAKVCRLELQDAGIDTIEGQPRRSGSRPDLRDVSLRADSLETSHSRVRL